MDVGFRYALLRIVQFKCWLCDWHYDKKNATVCHAELFLLIARDSWSIDSAWIAWRLKRKFICSEGKPEGELLSLLCLRGFRRWQRAEQTTIEVVMMRITHNARQKSVTHTVGTVCFERGCVLDGTHMLWEDFDVNYGMSDKIQKCWCTKALGRCLCPPNAFPANHT